MLHIPTLRFQSDFPEADAPDVSQASPTDERTTGQHPVETRQSRDGRRRLSAARILFLVVFHALAHPTRTRTFGRCLVLGIEEVAFFEGKAAAADAVIE